MLSLKHQTQEEQRLLKLFSKGNTIPKCVIDMLPYDKGYLGRYVEALCRHNGFKTSKTGVDLPDLGIEIKTRELGGQSATNWAVITENDLKNSVRYEDSQAYLMLQKHLRIIWVRDMHGGGEIRQSMIMELDDPTTDFQREFKNAFEYAQSRINSGKTYLLKPGARFFLEKTSEGSSWQMRSTEKILRETLHTFGSLDTRDEFLHFEN